MGYKMWFSDYFPSLFSYFLTEFPFVRPYLQSNFHHCSYEPCFCLDGISWSELWEVRESRSWRCILDNPAAPLNGTPEKNINDLKFEPHLTWIKEYYLEMCEVLVLAEHPVADWTGRDIFCRLYFLLIPVSSNFCSAFRLRSVNRLRFTRL